MTREELKSKKIGVLMGGLSAEWEVSLKSCAGVFQALMDRGYRAVTIDVGRDLAQVLVREGVEAAFVCLHGRYGEDGTIQGLLELLGIPYTGSGVLASALAMDKMMAKRILRAEGVPVPEEIVVRSRRRQSAAEIDGEIRQGFGYPVIVKPNSQGSTIGCSIVRSSAGIDEAVETALACDTVALIEPLIAGTEITVGLLGNEEPQILPIIEI